MFVSSSAQGLLHRHAERDHVVFRQEFTKCLQQRDHSGERRQRTAAETVSRAAVVGR